MSEQACSLHATALAERDLTGPDVNGLIAKAELAWRTALVELLRPALAARRPEPDIDVDALADHLFTTFEGGFIRCRPLEILSHGCADPRAPPAVEALLRLD
jgi:TetR/AcrR family transcriptional regulator, transcriptional repressor for nem operon